MDADYIDKDYVSGESHQVEDAIIHINNPKESKNSYLYAAVVHFANYLTRIANVGNSGDNGMPVLDPNVINNLKIRKNNDNSINIEYYIYELNEELEKAETFINLIQRKAVPESDNDKKNKDIIFANQK